MAGECNIDLETVRIQPQQLVEKIVHTSGKITKQEAVTHRNVQLTVDTLIGLRSALVPKRAVEELRLGPEAALILYHNLEEKHATILGNHLSLVNATRSSVQLMATTVNGLNGNAAVKLVVEEGNTELEHAPILRHSMEA